MAYLLLPAVLQESLSYIETNLRLETTGMYATVLPVETGKRTTGIGADAKISIGQYPISDASIGQTIVVTSEFRGSYYW